MKYLPRFREATAELEQFASREQWLRGDIAAYQLDRINEVWSRGRSSVPYYKELAERLDLPDSFASLEEYTQRMPLLPKARVQNSPEEFLASGASRGRWHRTGGSTGAPTAIYWEALAHRHILRAKYRNEQSHGLDVFDRKVFLWGHSGSFSPGWRGTLQRVIRPISDALRNRMRVSAYDLSDECLLHKLEDIVRFGPTSLYGYSSAIYLLSKVAEEHSIKIPNLKAAILTAEPADANLCQGVAKRLNCAAVLEYGATECPFMAGHTPTGEIRVRDDVVYLETIGNDSGGCDLVVTVLGNASFPLLRYCIEDTTSTEVHRPENGFGILADIQGRNNDMLVSKTGRRLHAMPIKHTLEHYPAIRRFTACQSKDGDLMVYLEVYEGLSEDVSRSLRSQFVRMLDGYPVTIEVVEKIPGNTAGKHRWIRSELASLHTEQAV